jgi:hypothetical protein
MFDFRFVPRATPLGHAAAAAMAILTLALGYSLSGDEFLWALGMASVALFLWGLARFNLRDVPNHLERLARESEGCGRRHCPECEAFRRRQRPN